MKRCPTPRFLAVIAAALLISLLAVSGFAQFQTGNIYGKVVAKDGSALPGVTVTLSGVGAATTTVADAQGNFRFLSLAPGSYTLKAELAGYGTSTRSGISVNVGRNSDVNLTLNPSVSESITVTAEAPLLDVRKAGDGANVTRVELEKVPTSRDPWAVLTTVPAVQTDRLNVGGSQSGQQSVYVAKGASQTDNTWNVDGVNITDMGATGSTPLYFDFDSFEEMQATTGGSDPRIMTPGVQLNMVTKRGTNDFRGSGRYFYTPGSLQSENPIPSEASFYLANTNKINYVRDYGAEIGGPLWRDHLWGWIADSENKISNTSANVRSVTTGQFPAFISPDNIILRDKNAKLNAQITNSNSAVGFYTFGDKNRNARNISPVRDFATSWVQTGPTKVYKLEDTQIFGSSLYLTGMWSKVTGGFSLVPNGGIGTPMYRDEAGVWQGSFYEYLTNRPQKQYRLDGSKFFDLGSMNHELKFGFGYRNTPVTSETAWPGNGAYYDFAGNSPCSDLGLPGTTCTPVAIVREKNVAYGEAYRDFYVGDTVLMGNLTLQVGVRADRQATENTPSITAANPLLSTPLTLPCLDGAWCTGNFTGVLPSVPISGDAKTLHWNSITPRVGLTYSLGADKKTLIRAAYNRYVSQVGSSVSPASPGTYSYVYAYGADLNNDKAVQRNELIAWSGYNYFDFNNPTSLIATTRVNYGMTPPKTNEFLLGFERELMSDFSIGVNFTYRKYNDVAGYLYEKHQGLGDFYTPADYVQLKDKNGNPVMAGGTFTVQQNNGGATFTLPKVPVYITGPGVPKPTFRVLTNLPGYSQKYDGVELTATKRMSHNWMLRANATWNNWTESCSSESNPNPTSFIGNCPGGQVAVRSAGSGAFSNVFINSRWNFNVTGTYQLPLDFNLGASLVGRQGYPSPWRDRVSGGALANTYGFNRVDVVLQPYGETRFGNLYELDLRAAKDFRFFNRVGLTLSGDLFNATNKHTILQRQTLIETTSASTGLNNLRADADRITEIQSPRVWRLGARLSF